MHCLSMKNNPLSVAYGNNDRILNTLEKPGIAIYMRFKIDKHSSGKFKYNEERNKIKYAL